MKPLRMLVPASCAMAILVLAGCGKTVTITRAPQTMAPPAKAEPAAGIPFYVKRAYCRQKATWNEPQYVVQVTGTADGVADDDLSTTFTMGRGEFLRNPRLQSLARSNGVALDVKTEAGCEQYRHLKALLPELADVAVTPIDDTNVAEAVRRGDLQLAENSAQIVPYVDYQTVYYYNTNRPVTGTSQVDLKLATDGTLTEGSAQVNDQALSSATGVLSSLLSGAGAAAVPLMMASAPTHKLPEECAQMAASKVVFKVSTSVQIYQHSHVFKNAAVADEPACLAKPLAEAEICGAGCSTVVTQLAPPAAKPEAPEASAPAKPKAPGDN